MTWEACQSDVFERPLLANFCLAALRSPDAAGWVVHRAQKDFRNSPHPRGAKSKRAVLGSAQADTQYRLIPATNLPFGQSRTKLSLDSRYFRKEKFSSDRNNYRGVLPGLPRNERHFRHHRRQQPVDRSSGGAVDGSSIFLSGDGRVTPFVHVEPAGGGADDRCESVATPVGTGGTTVVGEVTGATGRQDSRLMLLEA